MKKIILILMLTAIFSFAENPQISNIIVDSASFEIIAMDSTVPTGNFLYTDSVVLFDSLISISGCSYVRMSPLEDSDSIIVCNKDTVVGRWMYTDSLLEYTSAIVHWEGQLTYSVIDKDDDSIGIWAYVILDGKRILVDSMWGDYSVNSSMNNKLNFSFTAHHKEWFGKSLAKIELIADDINKTYLPKVYYTKPKMILTNTELTLTINKVGYPYGSVDSVCVDTALNSSFVYATKNSISWTSPSLEDTNYAIPVNIYFTNGFIFKDTVLIEVLDTIPLDNMKFIASGSHLNEFTISNDFLMDSTEITQSMYTTIMSPLFDDSTIIGRLWDYNNGIDDNYPAYFVNWYDALIFCNERSKLNGLDTVYTYDSISGTAGMDCFLSNVEINYESKGYRLPTEDEWEFAYRAGTTTDFYWGKNYTFGVYPFTTNDTAEINDNAVWSVNSFDLLQSDENWGVYEVASKLPNANGLYDMAGNVWEWCNDWYAVRDSSRENYTGNLTGLNRVLRSGSWGNGAEELTSSYRHKYEPYNEARSVGFRCVRTN